MSEKSPNPHGEAKILEMPIRTHQPRETGGRNVGQTTNTVGGVLNPSVAHESQSAEPPVQDQRTARRKHSSGKKEESA